MFDTLKYAKVLEEVGFTRVQSETSIRILSEVMDEKFATKHDILLLKQDIELLRQEMQVMKAELMSTITTRMGTMLAGAVGLIVALQKLL